LAWSENRIGGEYTTKLGYEVMSLNENNTVKWWWSKLWKDKTPKKTIIHMWLAFNDKVMTWELLQCHQT